MKSNWKMMAASLAVLVGVSGVAFGQDRDDHRVRDNRVRVENHDRDHDRDNRGWNNGRVAVPDNRRVYNNNGWYGDRDRDGDHDRDRRVYNGQVYNGRVYSNGTYNPYYGTYGNSGYYGNGGYYGGNAAQIGYQDGVNDGRNDRMTGHSFRPTQGDNFKDATNGYSGAYGDKQSYKNTYRQGYEQGYQQGYGR